jgi:hypothetical protein
LCEQTGKGVAERDRGIQFGERKTGLERDAYLARTKQEIYISYVRELANMT